MSFIVVLSVLGKEGSDSKGRLHSQTIQNCLNTPEASSFSRHHMTDWTGM
jgi:hypothetical protein